MQTKTNITDLEVHYATPVGGKKAYRDNEGEVVWNYNVEMTINGKSTIFTVMIDDLVTMGPIIKVRGLKASVKKFKSQIIEYLYSIWEDKNLREKFANAETYWMESDN